MAIKIVDVSIQTSYPWNAIRQLPDWTAVRNQFNAWQHPVQTTYVGQPITITVEVVENNWATIGQSFASWGVIRSHFANWSGLKNW